MDHPKQGIVINGAIRATRYLTVVSSVKIPDHNILTVDKSHLENKPKNSLARASKFRPSLSVPLFSPILEFFNLNFVLNWSSLFLNVTLCHKFWGGSCSEFVLNFWRSKASMFSQNHPYKKVSINNGHNQIIHQLGSRCHQEGRCHFHLVVFCRKPLP